MTWIIVEVRGDDCQILSAHSTREDARSRAASRSPTPLLSTDSGLVVRGDGFNVHMLEVPEAD
jgi:hypothetical protein